MMTASSGNSIPEDGPNDDGRDGQPGDQRSAPAYPRGVEPVRRARPRIERLGMQIDLRRFAIDRHRLAEFETMAQVGDAGLAARMVSASAGARQPARQDVLSQPGSRRAQQLVQAAGTEQIQIIAVDVMRKLEAGTGGALAAPLIADALDAGAIVPHGALCLRTQAADAL